MADFQGPGRRVYPPHTSEAFSAMYSARSGDDRRAQHEHEPQLARASTPPALGGARATARHRLARGGFLGVAEELHVEREAAARRGRLEPGEDAAERALALAGASRPSPATASGAAAPPRPRRPRPRRAQSAAPAPTLTSSRGRDRLGGGPACRPHARARGGQRALGATSVASRSGAEEREEDALADL